MYRYHTLRMKYHISSTRKHPWSYFIATRTPRVLLCHPQITILSNNTISLCPRIESIVFFPFPTNSESSQYHSSHPRVSKSASCIQVCLVYPSLPRVTIRSITTQYQNDSSQDRTTDDFSDWDCIFQQCKERHLHPSIERWMTQILHRDWKKGGS